MVNLIVNSSLNFRFVFSDVPKIYLHLLKVHANSNIQLNVIVCLKDMHSITRDNNSNIQLNVILCLNNVQSITRK